MVGWSVMAKKRNWSSGGAEILFFSYCTDTHIILEDISRPLTWFGRLDYPIGEKVKFDRQIRRTIFPGGTIFKIKINNGLEYIVGRYDTISYAGKKRELLARAVRKHTFKKLTFYVLTEPKVIKHPPGKWKIKVYTAEEFYNLIEKEEAGGK